MLFSFIIYCLGSSWWVLTTLGNTRCPGNICVGAQVSSDLISKASEFLYRSVFSGVLFISPALAAGLYHLNMDRLQGQLGIDTGYWHQTVSGGPGAERVSGDMDPVISSREKSTGRGNTWYMGTRIRTMFSPSNIYLIHLGQKLRSCIETFLWKKPCETWNSSSFFLNLWIFAIWLLRVLPCL